MCVVWSVWIGLVLMNGYRDQSADDGLVTIVQNYTGPHDYPPPYDSPGNFAHELRVTRRGPLEAALADGRRSRRRRGARGGRRRRLGTSRTMLAVSSA